MVFFGAPFRAPSRCRMSKATFRRYQLAGTRHPVRMGGSSRQLWNPSSGIRFSPKREVIMTVAEVDGEFTKGYSTRVQSVAAEVSIEERREKSGNSLRAGKRPSLYPSLDGFQSVSGSHSEWRIAYSSWANEEERNSSEDEQWEDALEEFEESEASHAGAWLTANPVKRDGSTTGPDPSPTAEAPKPLADPPITRLDFNISEDAFRNAQKATPGSPDSFWSYAMYRGPHDNGVRKRVKVHYCKSNHTMERVCQYFLDEKVLGFDMEWMIWSTKNHGPRANVSLIQLASPSRIALFHTAMFPKDDDFVAPSFRKIMENPEISKVGVAIKADCTRLEKHLGVRTRGIFELSNLYRLVKFSKAGQFDLVNKRLVPLAALVKEHLGLPMFKGSNVRSGDWMKPLTMDQIIYSASDAYAGVHLYDILERERESLDPCPPRPWHAELNLPIRLAEDVAMPASDEAAEAIESDEKDAQHATLGLSASIIKTIKESLEIEPESTSGAEADTSAKPVMAATIISRTPKSTPKKTPLTPKDSRITAAESWAASYRSTKKAKVGPAAARAYYIWYSDKTLTPEAIAKLLRQPPLQTNTVVGYILEAIRLEGLPYEKSRLENEVLTKLNQELLDGRYKGLVQAVQDLKAADGQKQT